MAQPKKLIKKITDENKLLKTCLSCALEQCGGKVSMPMNYKPKGIVINPPPSTSGEIEIEIKEKED